MNLKEYRTTFTVTGLVLMLVAATPTIGLFVSSEGRTEMFSELWILGKEHPPLVRGYPFNIKANESHTVFVGVGNHMGSSSYYMVLIKLRNQTQPSPDTSASVPSLLSPLSEFRFFITDGHNYTAQVQFKVLDISRSDNRSVFVGRLSINNATFSVNSSANWDKDNRGFYYQLFFELWRYEVALRSFQFHNRFVSIWLNVTA